MTEIRWLVDSYREWAARESIPIIEGLAVDLKTVETARWDRFGGSGAFVHLKARGDFLDVQVLDVAPGGATVPQRHLYEALVYVLDGSGSTVLEATSGEHRSFEWGPGSFFALPLNMRYRYMNASGTKRARLIVFSDLPLMINLLRDESFIFNVPYDFKDRLGREEYFRGAGKLILNREHRHMWETNFVRSLQEFDRLQPAPSRGHDSSSIMFVLGDSSIHAHMSEFQARSYKKGHRHSVDFHIVQLSGRGYSLYWYEPENTERIDWEYGVLHAPPDHMWHQHFNTDDSAGRYLAVAFGSLRYPITSTKRADWMGDQTKKGADQIEPEDEDPRIRKIFDTELARLGTAARDKKSG